MAAGYSRTSMARQRMIIGLGVAQLSEADDAPVAAGLAVTVAMAGRQQGHHGVVVSRLGQDAAADELTGLLREAGIETRHLQTDPDLPTGRVMRRILGRSVVDSDTAMPAFGNLQWDYDLVDLAQQADVVIAGMTAAQHSQTRIVMQQFLHECGRAIRVIDLTDLVPGTERRIAEAMLSSSDVAIIDQASLDGVAPAPPDETRDVRLSRLMRDGGIGLIIWMDDVDTSSPISLYHADGVATTTRVVDAARRLDAIVAILLSVVVGGDAQASVAAADTLVGGD